MKGHKAHNVEPKTECSQKVPGKQSKIMEQMKKCIYQKQKLRKSSKKEIGKFKKPQVSSAKELMKARKPSVEDMSKIRKQTLPSSMTDICKVSNASPSSVSNLGEIKSHLMKEQCTEMSSGNELQKQTGSLLRNMTKPNAAADSSLLTKFKQMNELCANKKGSLKELNKARKSNATTGRYLPHRHNLEMKDFYVKKTDSAKALYRVGNPSAITDHSLYEKPIWIKELSANKAGFNNEQCNIRKLSVETVCNKLQKLSQMQEFSANKSGFIKELCKGNKTSASSDRSLLRKHNQIEELAQKTEFFNGRKPANFSVPQKNKINEICAKKIALIKDSTKVKEAVVNSALDERNHTKELSKCRTWELFKMKRRDRKRKMSERKEPCSNINREARDFNTDIQEQQQNEELAIWNVRKAKTIIQFRSNEDERVTDMKNTVLIQANQISSYHGYQNRTNDLGFTEFRSFNRSKLSKTRDRKKQSQNSKTVPRKDNKNCAIEPYPQIRNQTLTSTVPESSLKIRNRGESSCNLVQKQRPSCTINNANSESYFGEIGQPFNSNIPDELYYRNFRNLCSDSQEYYRQGTQEQWTGYSCM